MFNIYEYMGELLAVLFIATVLFISGIILAFITEEGSGRKMSVAMIVAGLILYLACWIFTPRNDNFSIFDNKYQIH